MDGPGRASALDLKIESCRDFHGVEPLRGAFFYFEITRCGSARFFFFEIRRLRCSFTFSKSYGAVRCGADYIFQESYGAVRCGYLR